MRYCDFKQEGDKFKCSVCGHTKRRASVRECKSRGLGDSIAAVTNALGIKKCKPCEKRQEWLNRVLPYRDSR